jgi:NtrC-family two-component system response regulator AlgB
VRVLAATNRNLGDALKEGSFREDLYYRINAVRITLPPLRERPADVLLLAHHFLEKYRRAEGPKGISASVQKLLLTYRWQGNIRELEHVIERATLLSKGPEILEVDLPPELQNQDVSASSMLSLEEAERRHITRVLRSAKDLEEAAAILEIDPATLWRKRKRYGL